MVLDQKHTESLNIQPIKANATLSATSATPPKSAPKLGAKRGRPKSKTPPRKQDANGYLPTALERTEGAAWQAHYAFDSPDTGKAARSAYWRLCGESPHPCTSRCGHCGVRIYGRAAGDPCGACGEILVRTLKEVQADAKGGTD